MKNLTLVLYSISLVAFILSLLFAINYYTCFGYYLPHKPQVIYMASEDISAHSKPAFIAIDSDFTDDDILTIPSRHDYQGEVLVANALDKINLEWYVEQEALKCGCGSWSIEYYYSQFYPDDSTYPKAIITYENCEKQPDYPPNSISKVHD